MRIVYWARLALARAAIIERLQGLPGCDLVVADSLDAAVAALPGADGLEIGRASCRERVYHPV